ncbi:hypothetical protein OROMI_025356 [Orobanche minor]
MSEDDHKCIQIVNGVYATLSDDAKRCIDMIAYVRSQIKAVRMGDTLKQVADIATHYFQNLCPKKADSCNSTIFMCSWVVGPADMIFGSASGSDTPLEILRKYAALGRPINVDVVKAQFPWNTWSLGHIFSRIMWSYSIGNKLWGFGTGRLSHYVI